MVLSGAVLEWAIFLFFAAFDFWFVEACVAQITDPFKYVLTRHPTHVYGQVFSFILTFVFPYAFVAYYPTHYFFQLDARIFHESYAYATPLVAVTAVAVALIFWAIGLRHYQSTGT